MSVLLNAIVCFWNSLSSFLPSPYLCLCLSKPWDLLALLLFFYMSPFFPEYLLIWAIAHTSPLALENLNSQMHFTCWRSSLLVLSFLGAKKNPWNAGFVFFLTEESHRFEGSFTSNTAELILTSYKKTQVCPSVQSLEKLSYPLWMWELHWRV